MDDPTVEFMWVLNAPATHAKKSRNAGHSFNDPGRVTKNSNLEIEFTNAWTFKAGKILSSLLLARLIPHITSSTMETYTHKFARRT